MKLKIIVSLIAAGLAGCAGSPENRVAWETKPVIDVRHGMADSMAYYQIGRNRQAAGHLDGAAAAYDKALAADPKNLDALNALGALYADRGDLERAAAVYKRVAELAPQRAYLFNNIGYALHLQGRYAEAVEALRQAVTLDPGYERAWINLRNVAQKAGMLEMAALAERHSLPRLNESPAVLAQAEETQGAVAIAKVDNPESAPLRSTQEFPAEIKPPTVPDHASTAVAMKDSPVAAVAPSSSAPVGASRPQAIRMTEVTGRTVPGDGIVKLSNAPTSVSVGLASEPAAGAPVKAMKVSTQGTAPPAWAPVVGVRVEVSNGNGVNGYAGKIRAQLRSEGVGVSRMTNFTSFNIRRTVIEYRPGFAAAAQSVKDRLGNRAALKEARFDRPGTDIRIILGIDWLTPARVLSESEAELPPLG